ncbi:NAD(P)H-binding protein [Methylobrevis pamukkalensis]|uniref:NmrA-like family protein n=1 Tax=Methylobrevis pamukkalensis TaxID=1439726 RepID=A0A1E3H5S8_9HYPH|nr:NAD(P)H-binding protein [Methylobrevis pamukkalensis]ODN71677.1 NmrA-like family protein [Methylobrevis pamukkalensis]
MIVLTAPTGTIGRQLAVRLVDSSERVRIIVRDPARLDPAVRASVEVVVGSHGDPAVVGYAFEGAEAVFWLLPPNVTATSLEAAYVDFSRPAAEAIVRHGVGHVVSISALGRNTPWERRAGLVTASLDMDDLLAATGTAFRALTMPSFMDNMLRQAPAIREGYFSWPDDGNARRPTAATADIAKAACDLLLDRSWGGRGDRAVLGPEDLSPTDQARILSEVLGRPIAFRPVTVADYAGAMARRGASAAFVEGYAAMMTAKAEGMDNVVARTPENTTRTSFRAWCEAAVARGALA